MKSTSGTGQNVVFNYETMRFIIGLIALTIPFVCWLFFNAHHGQYIVPTSISVTYHLGARDEFVGMLAVVGSFLFAYNGYEHEREWLNVRWECVLAKVGAVCAGLVALFPTDILLNWLWDNELAFAVTDCLDQLPAELSQLPADIDHYCTVSNIGHLTATPYIHKGAAVVLLCIIFVFCLRFYTRVKQKIEYCTANDITDVNITKLRARKAIYRFCAIGMLVSFLAGLLMFCTPAFRTYWIFQVELVCLVLFGICWLASSKKVSWLANTAGVEQSLSDNLESVRHRDTPRH